MDFSAHANIFVLIIGIIIFISSFRFFSFSFAFWLGVSPLIYQFRTFENWEFLPADRLIKCLLFAVALVKLRKYWSKINNKSFYFYYALFIGALLISSAFSPIWVQSLGRSMTFAVPLMVGIMAMVCLMDSPHGFRLILQGIIAGVVFTTGYGILEFALQQNILVDLNVINQEFDYLTEVRYGSSGRVTSFLSQPVYAALYYFSTLPILLFYGRYYCKSVMSKSFIIVNFILGLFIVFLTGTRSVYLAIIFIPFLYLILVRQGFLKILGGYFLVAMIMLPFLPESFWDYTLESFNPEATKVSSGFFGRVELTEVLWEYFKENLLFGLGPGYVQAMGTAMESFFKLRGLENQYVSLLSESGLVGFTAFMIFLVKTLSFYRRANVSGNKLANDWWAMSLTIFCIMLIIGVSVSFINTIVMDYLMVYISITIYLQGTAQYTPSRDKHAFLQLLPPPLRLRPPSLPVAQASWNEK